MHHDPRTEGEAMSDYAKLADWAITGLAPCYEREQILAWLRDIRDGKLVVVPAEPTKEMILAAETAIADHKDSDWDSGGDGEQSNTYEYFTAGVERSVYRAMLAASQEKP